MSLGSIEKEMKMGGNRQPRIVHLCNDRNSAVSGRALSSLYFGEVTAAK
jgi:hypothetical protein